VELNKKPAFATEDSQEKEAVLGDAQAVASVVEEHVNGHEGRQEGGQPKAVCHLDIYLLAKLKLPA
jgi:hypothetical protein